MRYVLYGLIGIVFTALAAGVFIYMAAPTGYVRDRLVAEVKERTGRDLIVRGGASFTVYPRLGVELKDVSLSGPPGLEKEFFVRMEKLKLAIPLLRLMNRELAIDEFLLVKPIIQLAVDEKGRRTWDFTPPASVSAQEVPIRGAKLEGETAGSIASEPASITVANSEASGAERKLTDTLQGFSLGNVRIEGGEVRYANLLTKSTQRFTQVDIQLALSAIDAPFEATGSLVWRKERLPFTAKLETLKSFLDGAPARLVLALDAEHLDASYDGKLDLAGIALLDGKLTLKTASVREVAQWAQVKLPPVGGLGPLDLQTHLTIAGPSYTLAKAKLALDGATATGDLALDTGGVRPMLKGKLAIDKLDLNVYLADAAASDKLVAKSKKKKKAKSDDAKSDATGADAIPDIDETASVSETAEPVKPKKVSAGWSNAPIDVSGLKTLDADVTISAGALHYLDLKIGKSRVVLALKDGLLKTRLPELQAYGGKGLGTIQVDGTTQIARVTGNITVNGVSALPLLTDAMALDWIAGNGSISLGFTAQGHSQKALVQTLTGQGRFAFTDGAIVGLNIPQMVRGLGEGEVSGLQRDKAMKTDFSELSGTLSINKGIVTNKDLSLVGPLIRMAGAGTIDMPARSLDYAALPKVVASLEGQGGEDATGFTIPVRIQGPWAKPKVVPDLEGLAKNPEAVVETVKQLGKKLKDGDKKKVKKVLENLTGGKAGSDVENLIGDVLGQ